MSSTNEPGGLRLRSLLPIVAILLLLGGLYSYHQEASRLGEHARSLETEAEARVLRSRLLGRFVDGLEFAVLRDGERLKGEGAEVRVLWIVNPRTCIGCLMDLSELRKLARRPRVAASLVLTGVTRATAEDVTERAVDHSGRVLWDRDGAQLAALSGDVTPPPYLLLVFSGNSRVLAAEVGNRKTGCEPDLFENLDRLVSALAEGSDSSGRASHRHPLWTALGADT